MDVEGEEEVARIILMMHKACALGKEINGNFYSHLTIQDFTHGHHQVANTEIRLIIFFAVRDGKALYSQQKQDWELTVTQIMKSLLPNSDLN